MFKRISVSNFKAIGESVDLEVKPITLLFGPNSSGKTSIFQSLIYAYEIYINNNLNPVHTDLGGNTIDLGGYKNMVHNHDLDQDIKYEFEYSLSFEDLPDLEEIDNNPELFDVLSNIEYFRPVVSISVGWDKYSNMPVVKNYTLSVNDTQLVSVKYEQHPASKGYYYSSINYFHSLLPESVKKSYAHLSTDLEQIQNKFYIHSFSPNTTSRIIMDYLPQDVRHEHYDQIVESGGQEYYQNEELIIYVFLSRLISNLNEIIINDLKSLIYLGPYREVPERNFLPENYSSPSRWSAGLAAWDKLYNSDRLVAETNKWLKRLKIPYHLEIGKILELDAVSFRALSESPDDLPSVLDKVMELQDFYGDGSEDSKVALSSKIMELIKDYHTNPLLNYLDKAKTRLYIIPEENSIKLQLHDLGVGISQILPVIVSALFGAFYEKRMIMIEQPELHIHPAVQVELADLFITECKHPPKPNCSKY